MTMAQLTIMVLTKIYGIMKKVNRIFLPLAMVIPFVACNKEEVINPSNDGTLHIDVVAAVEDLANAADTKTYINGTDILWGTNEQMEIALIDPTDATKGTFTSSEATSEFDGKAQATFSFNVTMETEPASFIYGGVYPYDNGIDNTNPSAYKVSLPEIQNATAESYDPAAYILVAKAESFAEAQTTWMASFKRATALNKITLTNLEDGITSVEIILPEDAVIAGRRYIDLSTGALGEIYYNKTNSIRVNYVTALSAASKDIWFTSWNAEVPAGANITIKAYSETATYTHTITAREEGISFKEGYLNTLTVDMADAIVEEIESFEGSYLIASNYGNGWAIMTPTSAGKYYEAIKNDGVTKPVADITCFDFYNIEGLNDNVWKITKVDGGYAIMSASTGKYLNIIEDKNVAPSDEPISLSVTMEEDGTSKILKAGIPQWLQYNSGNPRFTSYSSTQNAVVLIPWVDDPNYKYCSVPSSLNVDAAAGTVTFDIIANVAWEITSDNTAFVVSPDSGSGAETVTLSYPENKTSEEVVVVLTVKNETGDKRLTIIQAAAPASYKKVTTVTSGKSYLIVAADGDKYYMAKPVTSNYGYLDVDEASVEGDLIYAGDENAFVIAGSDGNYTICQPDGRYLYMTGTHNSFNVTESPSSGQYWTIEAQSDGTVKISNVEMNKYVQYSTSYRSYGSYVNSQGVMPSLYEKVE